MFKFLIKEMNMQELSVVEVAQVAGGDAAPEEFCI